MLPFIKRGVAGSKLGQPPGTIVNFSEHSAQTVEFEQIRYNKTEFSQTKFSQATDVPPPDDSENITWLCFFGNSDLDLLKKTAELYEISQLALEDILNPDQRPKIDFYDNQILIILKMMTINDDGMLLSEQFSLLLGKNYVLVFQERPGDLFDPVRERLKNSIGRIRTLKADYLAFALVDIVVDYYFIILEAIAGVLEELELSMLENFERQTMTDIHDVKMQLFYLRKVAWPMREIAHRLQREEVKLLNPGTRIYFADVYDHTVRIIETTETLREVATGVSELYVSNISLKMNEIMQTLTIISTIFIPMTFVAGIYGMNFEYMPELKWNYGYFGALGIMFLMALFMLLFFRRKRWL
jgi:magnesium transporter